VLDYVAGGLTVVIMFSTIRRSLRAGRMVTPPGAARYFPPHFALPMVGPLAVVLIIGAGLAVAFRRRRPVFMLGVLLVGSLVGTALTGPNGSALTYFIPVLYVLFPVASTYEKRGDAVRILAAVFFTLLADAGLLVIGWGGLGEGGLVSVPLCVIIVWTSGYIVRQRRKYAVRLQDEAASKAVAQERLRIARELHDVVAHSMSVIAVQAGYGQYIIETQPGDARAALGAIQATSREALDEMRRMLGALRQADDTDSTEDAGEGASPTAGEAARDGATPGAATGAAHGAAPGAARSAPLFPAPGLADLDRLVSRTAGAGVRVEVTRFGPPRDLPASIDMSAYRIIQEALTNVVKHAQTSSCRVLLGYRDDELIIEITDNGAGMPAGDLVGAGVAQHRFAARNGTALLSRHGGPGVGMLDGLEAPTDGVSGGVVSGVPSRFSSRVPGGGHGIIGMRERVTLLGGEFSAGPLPGYGFRVNARIPLPPSTA
jgi:signal transduction histidine kinase